MKDLHDEFKAIWLAHDLPESFLSNIVFTGDPDQAVYSSFRLGVAALISIGLSGLSAAYLHFLRTGVAQKVTVDARHAVLSCHSEAYYTIDGSVLEAGVWDSIAGLYRTKNDGWVRIHTNFPHHRAGVLSILSIPDTLSSPATKDAVHAAIARWDAQALEDAAAERGMCVVRMRALEEWDASPQGRAVAALPLVDVRSIHIPTRSGSGSGPSPGTGDLGDTSTPRQRRPSHPGAPVPARPLSGLHVLDLSRVLAGPIAGRTLAAHGAQVLLVSSPRLPALPLLDTETSLGKRTARVDLDSDVRGGSGEEGGEVEGDERGGGGARRRGGIAGKETLDALVRDADVFLQAYRPGALQGKGFGVDEVVRMKMETKTMMRTDVAGTGTGQATHAQMQEDGVFSGGVVYASLSAWGWDGPWAGRRGFDSLVQTATGFNYDEGAVFMYHHTGNSTADAAQPIAREAIAPRPLPMQALDHAAGYFLAFGVHVALIRGFRNGGSHEVRVSLAGVGKWVRSLGRLRLESFSSTSIASSTPDKPPLPVLPKNAEDDEIRRLSVEWRERRGTSDRDDDGSRTRRRMTALRHAAVLEKTPVREGVLNADDGEGEYWGAPMRLDADDAVWVD